MKTILREDESGVSEVIGTILILGMTVVLFSTIIIWVTNIPTPTAQTRIDMESTLTPVTDAFGAEIGVNITIRHLGGDSLGPLDTRVYVSSQRLTNPIKTDRVLIHRWNGALVTPSGLLDGTNGVWEAGERWAYKNFTLRSSDSITVTIVDLTKSTVVWTATVTSAVGARPPIFVDKWADGIPSTSGVDPVQERVGFSLYARVIDPDGDLNVNSVYAQFSVWFGTGNACEQPQKMRDDGVPPDRVARDGIFSLGPSICTIPSLFWDGSIILLNATDLQGHTSTTRLVLTVGPQLSGGGVQTIPSQLWQYIGYVQIKAGNVWVTNLNQPYNTATTFQPYRVTATALNGNGGAMFHFKMENHGNRTIFVDGWTAAVLTSANRASVKGLYIVKPVDPSKAANAGGIGNYPGIATNPNNFQYAQVFDINLLDQETGGTPIDVMCAAQSAFGADWPYGFRAESLFLNILVSGMAGPTGMSYGQILSRWGASYNPLDHINDVDPTTRTQWYAQVIPFIGIVVY
jgi:FlaG/FlaF family flagellin (archaellin)